MKTITETYFYCPPSQIHTETVSVTGPEARHLCAVLRCAAGDRITVVDGIGHEYETAVERIGPDGVEGRILGRRRGRRDPHVRVTLAQAYGRAAVFDAAVEKATELGVSEIIPVVSRKSLPHQVPERMGNRLQRWRNLAISAMKQSRRSTLPLIHHPCFYDDLLARREEYALRLIAWEQEGKRGLRDIFAGLPCPDTVCVIVGPEAGLDEVEIALASTAGFLPFTMGDRRLRAETAGPLAVALILHECGEMGG